MKSKQVFVREVTKELAGRQPETLFSSIASRHYSFFLDSGCNPEKLGRYSIMGCDPQSILQGEDLDALTRKLKDHEISYSGNLPFVGGAVGFFSYDLGIVAEGVVLDSRLGGIPGFVFGFYDTVLVCDNLSGKRFIASRRGEAIDELLSTFTICEAPSYLAPPMDSPRIVSNFTEQEYCAAVERVRDYIRAGDTYQVNLSQMFSTNFDGDSWSLYKRLRNLSPSPFSAYLNFGETKVLSSSPERFLQVRNGIIETRPIKGTRPRGKTPEEDGGLKAELASSEKDRAEHVMIVDLERNDLGRVCEYGSVRVPEMQVIESYANVHHMVSTVRGKLLDGLSPVDCVRTTFPGGSITGAPKVRAMEIIDELEPTNRGIYCGSIGYLGYNNVCDLNIVIRTMIVKDDKLHFNVGGGIVYDSDPKAEYQETLDKAKGIMLSLGF